uniref:Uncharacterized protein n=2 Tax=Lotharella globosa TaxID=91324 RepID=A0A7S3YNU2_9EUKA|mmetsp:Transcript_24284/g.47428  ORF Transcript_24284/g.47428 Transcript_24284/m.47428 type:complete len:327 (-) Transcript_24284:263-1243(-)
MPRSRRWKPSRLAEVLSAVGIPCQHEGYTKKITKHWKIVSDASIRPSMHGDLCFELVSPILHAEAGMDEVRKVMELAGSWLGVEANKSTGFHVHVDGSNLSVEHIRKIASCFIKYESALDAIVGHHTREGTNNLYAKSNRGAFGTLSCRQSMERIFACRKLRNVIETVNPGMERRYKLNLTPLLRQSPTLEFRHHRGTISPDRACAWVRVLLHFVHNACAKPRPRWFPDHGPMCTRATELAHFFGEEIHDEALRDYYIGDDTGVGGSGSAASKRAKRWGACSVADEKRKDVAARAHDAKPWVCVCRKRFATSRQLFQHQRAKGHVS